jgi:hypothetical protein
MVTGINWLDRQVTRPRALRLNWGKLLVILWAAIVTAALGGAVTSLLLQVR